MIYLCLPFIFIILTYLYIYTKPKSNCYIFIIVLLQAMFFSLRYKVGTDWQNYLDYFNKLDLYKDTFEYGYYLINKTAKIVGLNYWVISFTTSILSISTMYLFLRKKVPILPLFFTLYFLLNMFNLLESVRSQIAFCIVLLSFHYYLNNRIILSFVFSSISILFHQTMVIIIPLLLFCKINITRRLYFIILTIGSALYFSNVSLFREILIEASKYLFNGKLAYYLSTQENGLLTNAFSLTLVVKIILFSHITLNKNKISRRIKQNQLKYFEFFYRIGCAYIFLYIFLIYEPALVYRLTDMLVVGYIATICYYIYSISGIYRFIYILTILIMFIYIYQSPFKDPYYQTYILNYTSFPELLIDNEKENYNIHDFWKNK
ncbi:EpsG family protein [Morganella morganii]|uniref:EpsG family protein n=1 Tax=Morganella morganii TaxID=582 RepID=UPI003D674FB6